MRLKYSINEQGIVISTQVIHSLGHGCDEEASRVVSLLRYNVPNNRKIRVKFHKTINIKFKPPKQTSIKINLTQKISEPKEISGENKGGYEYKIPI